MGISSTWHQQRLYPDFDRSLNYCDTQPDPLDTIYVGVDINVGNSVCQHLGSSW